MSDVVYVSKFTIERRQGLFVLLNLPGKLQPVVFSVHGAIPKHYRVDPAKLQESHSSKIDYVIVADGAHVSRRAGSASNRRERREADRRCYQRGRDRRRRIGYQTDQRGYALDRIGGQP